MKTILELQHADLKKSMLMRELDELEIRKKTIDPNSDEAYQLALVAFKKINQMLDL
jgi:hypothetical protein